MNYYVLLLLSLLGTTTAHAHFFAYQAWYNPTSGQTLEAYYDTHTSKKPCIDPYAQQQAFITRAASYEDVLVLSEDACSFQEQLSFNDSSQHNKDRITHVVDNALCTTPLIGLCAHAFLNGIDTCTIECRQGSLHDIETLPINSTLLHEINQYNDGPLLNNFYASIADYAQHIATACHADMTFFMHNFLCVDAKTVHTITNTSHRHIMLAAGSAHCISIGHLLYQLGWIPGELHLPNSMSTEEHRLVKKTVTTPAKNHVQRIVNYLMSTTHDDPEEYHALDITRIPTMLPLPATALAQCFALPGSFLL